MMRSNHMHSALVHRYIGGFEPERIHHARPQFLRPLSRLSGGIHFEASITLEETLARHFGMTHQRSGAGFKLLDENYSNVEFYLKKAFKRKASLRASEVAEELGIDYGIVRDIIARMIDEGKLGVK